MYAVLCACASITDRNKIVALINSLNSLVFKQFIYLKLNHMSYFLMQYVVESVDIMIGIYYLSYNLIS